MVHTNKERVSFHTNKERVSLMGVVIRPILKRCRREIRITQIRSEFRLWEGSDGQGESRNSFLICVDHAVLRIYVDHPLCLFGISMFSVFLNVKHIVRPLKIQYSSSRSLRRCHIILHRTMSVVTFIAALCGARKCARYACPASAVYVWSPHTLIEKQFLVAA